ncbi:Myo-inositol transporter 1 [Diplodia seriata]|uniref:Myo-inositol transporter 1 n=1 Tax=Diplodia seriata TaxID=420778 RepID=A0A1S8BCR9_9PEZI|nr:Myo-inositol transporter 1 [Diplodia seriata]
MSSDEKNSISAEKQEDVMHIETVGDVDKLGIDDSIEETECGKMAWFISMAVSTGGFLFGYDTGVISSVLVTINDDLGQKLASHEQELITSLTSGGALIGAIAAGTTADRYGRKFGIYLGCLLFIAGSIIQAAAFSLAQMSAGRFIVGLGVGSAAMIIPLYIGELAPAKYRGRKHIILTTTDLYQWRYTVGIGAAPAILLALMLPKCPESARQLIAHGKLDEAAVVIRKIFPKATDKQVKDKVQLILNSVHEVTSALEDKTLWWQFKQLFTVSANARPLISTCVVMAVSQLGGFNTLMYYSGTLFGLVGFNKPVAVSIVVGATNFIFSLVCITLLDRFGRRIVVLVTCMGMCISLVIAAVAFSYIPINKDLVVETREIGWPGILVLITIICYVAFFASGVATISWVGTELLPVEVRALGTMVVSCYPSLAIALNSG